MLGFDLLIFSYGSVTSRRDWSWRVRFAALQGLMRICRHCHDNSIKDGIRAVAWNALMHHHSAEKDVRVLEAWKLAQVKRFPTLGGRDFGTLLNGKFRYKRQLARPRCHSFVNQQRTRQELVIR